MRTTELGIQVGDTRLGKEIGKTPPGSIFVWDSCEKCGRERWVRLIRGMPNRMRCLYCRYDRFQLPKPKAICLNCGREFTNRNLRANLLKGWGQFCSISCGSAWKMKQGIFQHKPNYVEKLLTELIGWAELPFKYVGSGEVWLGNRNPDFININGKKQVIELFGAYWHPESDVGQRTEHYKKYGFSTLVIWASELASVSSQLDVVGKIISFQEEC